MDANNLGPNKFTVLTDPDGRILVILGAFGSEPGLVSEDPLSYLAIAPALLDLMKVGGRLVLRMVSKRALKKAALLAAARAVAKSVLKKEGKLSAEEMIAHLTDIVRQRPELRRLMAASVLTEQRLTSATLEAVDEWARTRSRRVVWKTEAEMVKVTNDAKNLMTLQGNELWINEEAKALKEAKVFYQEVVHELASDSLGYRGSNWAKFFLEMPNGTKYTDQTLLENAVLRGNIEQVVRFFSGE
jgi:fructose-specific component phosphotransferase system IIB-like protein